MKWFPHSRVRNPLLHQLISHVCSPTLWNLKSHLIRHIVQFVLKIKEAWRSLKKKRKKKKTKFTDHVNHLLIIENVSRPFMNQTTQNMFQGFGDAVTLWCVCSDNTSVWSLKLNLQSIRPIPHSCSLPFSLSFTLWNDDILANDTFDQLLQASSFRIRYYLELYDKNKENKCVS